MNNILKLLKYNFGRYNSGVSKLSGVIVVIIILLLGASTFINIPFVSEIVGLTNMAFVVSVLGINFIVSLVTFFLQISKEQGKLIFMFPIKSWEYLAAKYLEFIIFQLGITLVFSVIAVISGSSVQSMLTVAVLATGFGTIIGYIIITAFTVIVASYIHNSALCLIAVIFGGGIVNSIVETIIWGITRFLPYVYIRIGSLVELDLISVLLEGLCIIGLLIIANKHLDKKLDIV